MQVISKHSSLLSYFLGYFPCLAMSNWNAPELLLPIDVCRVEHGTSVGIVNAYYPPNEQTDHNLAVTFQEDHISGGANSYLLCDEPTCNYHASQLGVVLQHAL
jgi:hypothetical protein